MVTSVSSHSAYIGDLLHKIDIALYRGIVDNGDQWYISAERQSWYLKHFHPELVPPPVGGNPPSDHRVSTFFEALYATNPAFAAIYRHRLYEHRLDNPVPLLLGVPHVYSTTSALNCYVGANLHKLDVSRYLGKIDNDNQQFISGEAISTYVETYCPDLSPPPVVPELSTSYSLRVTAFYFHYCRDTQFSVFYLRRLYSGDLDE
jgi:hypothetical protein